jgi:hypothetical protein
MSASNIIFNRHLILVVNAAGLAACGVMALGEHSSHIAAGFEPHRAVRNYQLESLHAKPLPEKGSMYHLNVCGIDSLTVKSAEPGELICFNCRCSIQRRPGNSTIRSLSLPPSLLARSSVLSYLIPNPTAPHNLRATSAQCVRARGEKFETRETERNLAIGIADLLLEDFPP